MLWPVLHYRFDLAEFSRRDLSGYMRVNEHFANELDKMLRPDDLVWVHDYHLIPLAKALRARGHQEPHRLSSCTFPVRRRKCSPRCRTTSG